MDILEIAEEAYYERKQERREEEAQHEKDEYREERDCGICDIAEDVIDYFRN